jgi:transposase-like protein
MVTFYSFPQEHWRHLQTTNILESPFSSVRLRTDASRRYKRSAIHSYLLMKSLTGCNRTHRATTSWPP